MPGKLRKPTQPMRVQHAEKAWIEIGQAARLSRMKATAIREEIVGGLIESLELEGRTYIPLADANRLKRERGVMITVGRMNKKRQLPPSRSFGVLAKESMTWFPGPMRELPKDQE